MINIQLIKYKFYKNKTLFNFASQMMANKLTNE